VHHYLADESNPEAERNLTLIPLTSEIEIKKKKRERGVHGEVFKNFQRIQLENNMLELIH
jgi:hypothetical protein